MTGASAGLDVDENLFFHLLNLLDHFPLGAQEECRATTSNRVSIICYNFREKEGLACARYPQAKGEVRQTTPPFSLRVVCNG